LRPGQGSAARGRAAPIAREPARAVPADESRRALTSRARSANDAPPRTAVKSGVHRSRPPVARIRRHRAPQRRRAVTPTVALELRRYGDAGRRRQHATAHR